MITEPDTFRMYPAQFMQNIAVSAKTGRVRGTKLSVM